jgi:hypothetical protein
MEEFITDSALNSFLVSAISISFLTAQLLDNNLKKNIADASRAVILECDEEECVQVDCVKDAKGNWQCDVGLEGKPNAKGPTTQKVIMMSMDDDP